MQPRARGLPGGVPQIIGQCFFALVVPGDVIEHRLEALRWIVAVESHHDATLLVQEQQCGRELDLQPPRELLFTHDTPVQPGHLAVAPHIESDRHKMLACFVDDAAL
jgi:hypothetical protein